MSDPMYDADRGDPTGWKTVARHDFDGVAELDATITAVLDGRQPGQPLYDTVDVEPAEQFLASVGDADASVVFRTGDHAVRVSADGRVQLRDPPSR